MNYLRRGKYSLDDLSFVEEMNEKLRILNSMHQTTNAIIARLDLHRKRVNQQKSMVKRRTLPSMEQNLSRDRRTSQPFDAKPFHSRPSNHLATPPNLTSPTDDEFSSITSKQTSLNERFPRDFQDDSHFSDSSYRKHRITHSIISSSSPSKNSHDEPPLTPDPLRIEKVYIINEIYPSIESEYLNQTPLAFLGSEKFLHLRIDWNKVRYPLSAYLIEIIIDLILTRPSFIREIPKVTQFNLYRPLIRTISGRLFFDHGDQRAAIHQCHRILKNYNFTVENLASIHRREFHIINHNTIHEQRFVNLYENLFPMYSNLS